MAKYNEDYDNSIGPEIGQTQGDSTQPKMPAGLRFCIFLILVIGMIGCAQIATQHFAENLGYAPQLGPSDEDGWYPFWKIFEWFSYRAAYPDMYNRACITGFSMMCFPFVLILLIKAKYGTKLTAQKYLHGSARWANEKDIVKMGLLPYHNTFKDYFAFYIKSLLYYLLVYKFILNTLFFHLGTADEKAYMKKHSGIENFFKKHTALKKHFAKPKYPRDEKPDGVFVGAWMNPKTKEIKYLRHNGPEHILCAAPTRSGKGVGLVNPTLLTWQHSLFVMDLKGELWYLSSGWRKKYAHNLCIRFEPATPREEIDPVKHTYNIARWNPFDEIRAEGSIEYTYDFYEKKMKTQICDGKNEIADTQNIATLIVDPDGKGLEDHWAKTAFALLVGCIIHLKHNCPDNCSPQTLDLLLAGQIDTAAIRQNGGVMPTSSDSEGEAMPIANLWADMCKGLDKDGKPYKANGAVITAGADMKDRPKDEGGSVLSTAKSFISLYRDPIVAANTSASDFRIKQLMIMPQPVSLYVITQPTDKGRLKPLVRLLVNLVLRLLADKLQVVKGRMEGIYAHRMLLMLDEFPSLGKLDIMQESLAFVAGYGLKVYIITQDLAQLFALYTKDESIRSNCHIQNYYAPLNAETAEIISKKCGTTTKSHESISVSGSGFKASKSRSMQDVQRSLLTPDEVMNLPGPKKEGGNITEPGKMLIFVAGYPAIYGVQPLYFQDKTLLARAQVPSPEASDVILRDGKVIDLNSPATDSFKKQTQKMTGEQPHKKSSFKLKKVANS